jgi:hypothetical protein
MSLANLFAAKLLGTDIPKGFRPYKTIAEEFAHTVVDPVASQWREGKRVNQLPVKEQVVEQAKRTGAALKEVARSVGTLGTSAIDATQMALRDKVDPIDWEKTPFKGIPSLQRQAELKIQNGMSPAQAITEATTELSTDALAILGMGKVPKAKKPLVQKPVVEKTVKKEPEFIPHPSVGGEGVVNDTLKTSYELQKKSLIL